MNVQSGLVDLLSHPRQEIQNKFGYVEIIDKSIKQSREKGIPFQLLKSLWKTWTVP